MGARRSGRANRLAAAPNKAKIAAILELVEVGEDWRWEGWVVELDRVVGALLAGDFAPGCAELDGAGEDTQVRGFVAVLVSHGRLAGLDVEGERLDGAVENAVVVLGEGADLGDGIIS